MPRLLVEEVLVRVVGSGTEGLVKFQPCVPAVQCALAPHVKLFHSFDKPRVGLLGGGRATAPHQCRRNTGPPVTLGEHNHPTMTLEVMPGGNQVLLSKPDLRNNIPHTRYGSWWELCGR